MNCVPSQYLKQILNLASLDNVLTILLSVRLMQSLFLQMGHLSVIFFSFSGKIGRYRMFFFQNSS